VIRVHERQLEEIGRALALEHFEDEMVAHLHGFSPWHSEVLGDAGVRRTVRLGVERAGAHGLTGAGSLRFYVELMFMFGSRFDTDPLLPWAGEVLRDPGIAEEAGRIDRLHRATLAYLEAVNGADHTASLEALRRIKRMLREDIRAADLRAERRAIDTMRQIHPMFCAYVGEPPLRELVCRGPQVAAQLDVATDGGVVLVTAMMFTIGHGFAEDPLFPWVRATLRDPSLRSPDERVAGLRKRAELCLDRALDRFEGRRTDAAL
jgi:hypothetical protein